MLLTVELTDCFWDQALNTAVYVYVYVYNRTLHEAVGCTSSENYRNQRTFLEHLKVLGC
jgi:hypothetical protein